jgi:hypothetical protein
VPSFWGYVECAVIGAQKRSEHIGHFAIHTLAQPLAMAFVEGKSHGHCYLGV